MAKTRLILIGGFLGVGKTTLLLQAARHLTAQGLRVGLVTNDQGQNLVDTALVKQHLMPVEEVAGGCFCCRFPDLLDAARRLQDEVQPDIILAEPVGSCTDLMATIVRPIQQYHAEEFDVAPLTILLDPERDLGNFPSTVNYLYRQQLSEAEIIALNKSDLLDSAELKTKLDVLEDAYPESAILSLSARTEAGVDEWLRQVMTRSSQASPVLDIDYGIYAEAEATLGWLNAKLAMTSAQPIVAETWVSQIFEALQTTFSEQDMSVAHLKMNVDAPNTRLKASLTQLAGPLTWDVRAQDSRIVEAEVNLNARVNTTPDKLRQTVETVIQEVCQRTQTDYEFSHFECFSPLPPEPTFRILN